ncbi:unnamed protein product, partial [Symbiodinium pilosum]
FVHFPYHNDPEVRPEKHNSAKEFVIIAKPSLIDDVALTTLIVRHEAPLHSNLLKSPFPCPSGQSREFAGPMMQESHGMDPARWRANHYVQALGGRRTVFDGEEPFPMLRSFSMFDAAAVELGYQLERSWAG